MMHPVRMGLSALLGYRRQRTVVPEATVLRSKQRLKTHLLHTQLNQDIRVTDDAEKII
jgi:hypothetical protein